MKSEPWGGMAMWGVALLAPFVLVRGASWLTGSGPSESGAAVPTPVGREVVGTVREAAPALTALQRGAMAWEDGLGDVGSLRSPMWRAAEVEPEVVELDLAERYVVSTVMGGDRGAMAVVNGRLCRVGDELEAGWRIEGIDASGQTVSVRHADGTAAVLHVAR